jgi:hypothetical protein
MFKKCSDFKNMHIFKNIMISKIRKIDDAAYHIEELPCWAASKPN